MTRMTDFAGYIASTMVLLTFMTKDMRRLRVLGILSNITFITYGVLAWLPPVFCLHLLLLPVNVLRLRTLLTKKGLPAAGSALVSRHFRRHRATNSIQARPEHVATETSRTYNKRRDGLAVERFGGCRALSIQWRPSCR